jgi:hypothetical protein
LIPSLEKRKIPLLDLAAHAPIRDELIAEMIKVVDSQKFIMGDAVKELERLMAHREDTPAVDVRGICRAASFWP